MVQQIAQVDAFTSLPYAGNPAAVCLLDAPADETWMRSLPRSKYPPCSSDATPRHTWSGLDAEPNSELHSDAGEMFRWTFQMQSNP